MASIKSQMTLNDGMSATINRITKSLQTLTGSFIAMQQASANGVNTQNFEAANAALVRQINLAEQLANEFSNVADETERSRKNIEDSTNKTESLMSKAKKVVTTLGITAGAQKLIALSDQRANNTARLSLLVDDGGSVSEVENMIFASAMRSRSAYQDTVGTVAKLGVTAADAFSDASGNLDFEQVIGFTELLNKNFVIGGASASEQAAAMYQLTQAMASGRLQGDEYKSIIENAPLLAASIEDYMRNVAGAEGSMKDWASQGLLTADVIKAAVFSTARDVNNSFDKIPLTWSQVWTMTQNIILRCLSPVLDFINLIANNLDIVAPLALGAAAAIGVYMLAVNGAKWATAAWSVVQKVFNAVMKANPIVRIVMLVIALIAVVMAVCNWIAKTTGAAESGFGIIAGGINVVIQCLKNFLMFLGNVAIGIWYAFGAVLANLGILFNNLIANAQGLFYDLLGTALTVVETICAKLNELPFIEFDYSGISDKANEYRAKSEAAYGRVEEYNDIGAAFAEGFGTFDAYSDGWMEDAFKSGAAWGDGVSDAVGGAFGLGGDGFNYDELMGNVGAIAGNTDAMAGGLDVSNEQLEYLRDIAERDAVNRFTTAEVKIDMTGMTNKISGSADLDGVISGLTEGFAASLLTAAEGVPA